MIFSYFTSVHPHSPERSKAPVANHGGVAKRLGDYNVEIVAHSNCVSIFVNSISNLSLSTANSSAVMEMFVKGNNPMLKLLPKENNELFGCSDRNISDARMAKIELNIYAKESISKLIVLKRSIQQ
tara:strand:- start:1532 stop:1909 length:378 start_codon:yes stop_codon:yes gene_type:complete